MSVVMTTESAIGIAKHIEHKKDLFYKKADRARSTEKRSEHWERYKLYSNFSSRAFDLIWKLRNPKKFGQEKFSFLIPTLADYKKREAERIAKGKEKFENLHTYSVWFLGTGLHHDYGTFICSRCKREFYHSPSRISKAGKIVFQCACGHCTNEIIIRDYRCDAPFN